MTLGEAFGRYWTEIAAYQVSAEMTDRQALKLIDRLGNDTLLSDLTGEKVADYIARRRNDRIGKAPVRKGEDRRQLVKGSTANRDIELLRRVMRRAKKTWKVSVTDIEWDALLLPEAAGRTRSLSPAEERRLFRELRPDYWPLILFGMLTGLRKAALVGLAWRQVDWDQGTIHVRLKAREPGGRPHVLPITGAMAAILQQEQGNHPEAVFTYVCRKTRRIPALGLIQEEGRRYPFTPNGFGKDWRAALAAAGIEDFRFHDLRHTAATRILAATGNLKAAMALLGHSDISSTARYAHVNTDELRRLMEGTHAATSRLRHGAEEGAGQEVGKKRESAGD